MRLIHFVMTTEPPIIKINLCCATKRVLLFDYHTLINLGLEIVKTKIEPFLNLGLEYLRLGTERILNLFLWKHIKYAWFFLFLWDRLLLREPIPTSTTIVAIHHFWVDRLCKISFESILIKLEVFKEWHVFNSCVTSWLSREISIVARESIVLLLQNSFDLYALTHL